MRSRSPSPVFYFLPLAGYWLVLIYYLGAQWSVYEQYHYGWAVPFLCAYLMWRRTESRKQKTEIGGQPVVQASPSWGKAESRKQKAETGNQEPVMGVPSTLNPQPSTARFLLSSFPISAFQRCQLFSFALLAFLYAPTRFFHEANPTWRLTSWLWALEVIGLTLLLVGLRDHASTKAEKLKAEMLKGETLKGGTDQRDQGTKGRRDEGTLEKAEMLKAETLKGGTDHASRSPSQLSAFQHFRFSAFHPPSFSDFVFPACFFLVAVPWPSALENFLTQSLMQWNAAATAQLLGLFGVPALQHGNVIEVSRGVVGIDEACSGIRSLQATLMISLFLGEVYRLTVRRRVWLVALGFGLAFVFNVGRTLLLTGIASARGIGAVASWHDPAGVTILVGCFLSLWLIARALGGASGGKAEMLKSAEGKAEALKARGAKAGGQPGVPFSISAFRRVSNCLIAWFLLVEGGTECWYRLHERGARDYTNWSVAPANHQAPFQAIHIPSSIRGQFGYDEGLEGRWQDANGGEWQLYYFRWYPAHSLSKRVTILLAKTHGPEKCLSAAGMRLRSDRGIVLIPAGGLELAVRQYVFEAEGRLLHVFYGIYEDQGGSRALVNRRLTAASRIQAALSGSRNYGQRFLEAAVYGYETPEDARAALVVELGKRIKVGK